jgi:diguanylate cyclase (GGDEF)-like protein
MSLRTRLWLVLGGLFLVPLMVGALVIGLVVPGVRAEQVEATLRTGSAAMTAQVVDECRLLSVTVRAVALEADDTDPAAAAARPVDDGTADYVALLGADGTVVSEAGTAPDGLPGDPAGAPGCSVATDPTSVLLENVQVRGVPGVAAAVAVRRLDEQRLAGLARRAGVPGELLLLGSDGEVIVTSADPGTTSQLVDAIGRQQGPVQVDGWLAYVEGPRPGAPYDVVVAAPRPGLGGDATALFALILLFGATAAGLLVSVVARSLSQPFTEITEAAERVMEGNLDTEIETGSDGEAGRLGEAFNRMTTELRSNMTELERSREDLRHSLERIGETLMSTHDLEGLLQVVLETAVATLQAEAGVVLYGAPDQVRVVAEHGLHEAGLSAPVGVASGDGVLGRVLASGESVRGHISSGPPQLTPAPTEPRDGEVLAVPLRSMGSVIGALALYGRVDDRPFDGTDDDALRTLAGQASIAIDNVQLHQEAQRLSTTDPLTGLWNFRYLSMSLAREIERSTRFERPLAVLMLDLDHFKLVNDHHGHARGDDVLRELAHRVQEQIREVDTFARYGGEEFVVVLPETTVEGAAQLAERICTAVRREPFGEGGEEPLHVTVSVGGAAFPIHGASAATLMRAADKALYVAKNGGRDRSHVPGE